jgi:hypothetical protein
MTTHFVQLEELDERLRGRRLVAYLPPTKEAYSASVIKYIHLIVSNISHGNTPFNRILCATNNGLYRLVSDALGATLTLTVREAADWSLLLTAANSNINNTLVITFPDCKCPDAFVSRLPAGCTLLMLRFLDDAAPVRYGSLIFFPHVRDINTELSEAVVRRIQALGLLQPLPDLVPILKELRIAGAGLVITVIPGGINQLHWWDAAEELPALRRRPELTAAILHFLADSL